jgi:hypothetical protein
MTLDQLIHHLSAYRLAHPEHAHLRVVVVTESGYNCVSLEPPLVHTTHQQRGGHPETALAEPVLTFSD